MPEKMKKAFLSCGGDYGYRDMVKRSNIEGRQYLYRELKRRAKHLQQEMKMLKNIC